MASLHAPKNDVEKILFGLAEELGCVNINSVPKREFIVWSFLNGGIWINFHAFVIDSNLVIKTADNAYLASFDLSNPKLIDDVKEYFKPCGCPTTLRLGCGRVLMGDFLVGNVRGGFDGGKAHCVRRL